MDWKYLELPLPLSWWLHDACDCEIKHATVDLSVTITILYCF